MGRPAKLSEELGQRICARIMNGESVRAICADDGMPSRSTFFNWLADEDNEWFRRAYMLAKDAQADVLADEILDIADDASNDWMRRNGGNEEEWQLNHDQIQRSRLQIDARKWMAAKLKPKKYSDRLAMEHSGRRPR